MTKIKRTPLGAPLVKGEINLSQRKNYSSPLVYNACLENEDGDTEIVEESGTDPEDKASQCKLQRARVSPYRRRATPITIISVGVNETTAGEGMEHIRGRGRNANAGRKAHVCRELGGGG
ncbi:hypothetical protein ALC56_11281 [Trachymyrmex septentrionalis]|uniref:Uncharacterized protein n=1 Tax=Trachymyrmex septentrionalis TaxID=34720 RepID=A0A195F0R8_9HYME|nr:hypothetical protein ALC56_11281 [Trachymyrmex septentrionalis]